MEKQQNALMHTTAWCSKSKVGIWNKVVGPCYQCNVFVCVFDAVFVFRYMTHQINFIFLTQHQFVA